MPAIKKGFAQTSSPGRLDLVSYNPFTLVDGAHNADGMRVLARFLDTHKLPAPDTLVVGAKRDKDITALLDLIAPRFRRIITTEGNYQPMPATTLATSLHLVGVSKIKVQAIPDLNLAIKTAQTELKPGTMLLITGSLYLVGDTLSILRHK